MKMNQNEKKGMTDAEAERALNDALRLGASVFPQTEEDIDALETETDPTQAPTPDVLNFRKLLAGGQQPATPAQPIIAKFELAEVTENWACAARNGSQITPDIRAKMDASREAAKNRKRQS